MTEQTGALDQTQTAEAAPLDDNTWTDIGQAEIVYTMFGRAKVRVIHKGDKERQTKRMLVAVVVFAIAGYWLLTNMDYFRQPEILLVDTAPAVVIPSETIAAVSAPVSAVVADASVVNKPAASRVYRKPVVTQQANGTAAATSSMGGNALPAAVKNFSAPVSATEN